MAAQQQIVKGIQTIAQVFEKNYVTPTIKVGTAKELGLNLKQLAGDTVSISHKSPLSEVTSYLEGVAREGKSYKPAFENPDSVFAQYVKSVEKFNTEPLSKTTNAKCTFKLGKKTKPISMTAFKDYIFDNADKLNVSKDEYWQLVDKIALDVKNETQLTSQGLRQEFVENSDKIHKWAEIFRTQHYDKVAKQNIYNKFYDEKMFNQAVKEYTEFVEKITGKKVLIGCASRMNFPISALGMLNNPNAYKDFDYILLGHGKGSSLITDITNPDTWRFADNDKSIYEFIEKNIPKDKKVLVFCCETDGLRKAGKTAAEMVDRQGQQMYGIGKEVCSHFLLNNEPAKICKSGTRHIIGQVSEKTGGATDTSIGRVQTMGFGDFSLSQVKDPKIIYYDLDYTPCMVENIVKFVGRVQRLSLNTINNIL